MRCAAGASHGLGSVRKAKGLRLRVPRLVRAGQVAGRRLDPVVDAQRRLDQARQPGGRLGVAYLRLHRAEDAAAGLGAGFGEDLGQAVQLGLVAQQGSGAMGLDQPHLGRRDPGLPVSPAHGPDLPGHPRRDEAPGPAVAGGPTPLMTA